MVNVDQVLRDVDVYAGRLTQAEREMTRTFEGLNLLSKPIDWDSLKVPKIDKLAGGLVIIDKQSLESARSLGGIRMALQLARIGQSFYGETTPRDYYRVAVPGGAVRSNEELAAIADGTVPETDRHKAFYYVVEQQLLKEQKVTIGYDLDRGRDEVMASEAVARVQAEMGEAAASTLNIQGWASENRKVSFLKNIQLINPDNAAEIVRAIGHTDVQHTPGTTKISGIITRVNEGNLIALAQVGQVLDEAEETDHQRGVKIVTMAEALRIAESGASEEGYKGYKELYPNDRHDGPRNPSLMWHLGEAVKWIGRYVRERDTYVEGSPRMSHLRSRE